MSRGHFAIGIDIGGTKIAVASVSSDGAIGVRQTISTEADKGFDRALERISRKAEQVIRENGRKSELLAGIGIGCAGPVNPSRGTIHNPYTLPTWNGCDIVTPLHKRFGVPVYLENDADAAALGECFTGAGSGLNPVVILTFGTGIGGSVILDGKIVRGAAGEHPELGHIPAVASEGPACYCGRAGCLESLASGTAIETAGREAGISGCREVFAAAANGNARAQRIVDRALAAMSAATWTILHTFLPERIVLGGGMMDEQYELFAPVVERGIAAATMAPKSKMSVAKAALGNDAGIVGAALLAMSHFTLTSPK